MLPLDSSSTRTVWRARQRASRAPGSTDPTWTTRTVSPEDPQHTEATGRRYALLYHRLRLTNAFALGVTDALALAAALLLAGLTRWWLFGNAMIPQWGLLIVPGWWLGAWMARLLPGWGLSAVEALRRVVLLLTLAFLGMSVGLFLSKQAEANSRFTITLAYLLSLPLVPFARSLTKRLLITTGRWGLPTVIYGAGPAGRRVIEALHEETSIGYNPVAIFDDDPDSWGDTVAGVPVLGSTEHCLDTAPIAILALPDAERHHCAYLLDGPLAHYKQVIIIPDLFDIPSLWVRSRDMAGVLGLEITSNLLDPLPRLLKRGVDLTLVLLTLPLWLPLCGLLALLIRLQDGGPALYVQERIGQHQALFRTFKFRTMAPDAEHILQDALDHDPALRAEWDIHFKLRNDPRTTRLGAFLRRSSLDELPQLFNVLRGEMSLVGPRPLPAYHQAFLSDRTQHLRSRLRPGLTGLWQVSGRSDSGNEGLERWDTYYARNWSVWLDLVILVRTFRVLFRGSGAY